MMDSQIHFRSAIEVSFRLFPSSSRRREEGRKNLREQIPDRVSINSDRFQVGDFKVANLVAAAFGTDRGQIRDGGPAFCADRGEIPLHLVLINISHVYYTRASSPFSPLAIRRP